MQSSDVCQRQTWDGTPAAEPLTGAKDACLARRPLRRRASAHAPLAGDAAVARRGWGFPCLDLSVRRDCEHQNAGPDMWQKDSSRAVLPPLCLHSATESAAALPDPSPAL